MPHTKHYKGKVEGQKLKIQEILGTLDAPPPDETPPADSHNVAATSTPESGAPLTPPLQIFYGALITSALLKSMF